MNIEAAAVPYTLHLGDCIEVMRAMPDNSVDSIVTDPPYGLEFMGKEWDGADGFRRSLNKADVGRDNAFGRTSRTSRTSPEYRAGHLFQEWCEAWATEALRVLKPGGHLLAFSGSRTYHRMTCAIEDAGFEVRDQIMWVYGSGFPKSLDVSKAIDKQAGAEREVIGRRTDGRYAYEFNGTANRPTGAAAGTEDAERIGGFVSEKGIITAPATAAAEQWDGWGTALKPAHEPICVARKPLIGTVAANVLAHGTGAINIDGCRVAAHDGTSTARKPSPMAGASTYAQDDYTKGMALGGLGSEIGRWPANLIHDGSDEVVALFPAQAGAAAPVHKRNGDKLRNSYGAFAGNIDEAGSTFHGDTGSAARFFYCAKATKTDRGEGNTHPTVKPTNLMAYLVRLVTPPGGICYDPFTGSGSTGKACMREGFRFIGSELSPDYIEIARARIAQEHARAVEAAERVPPPIPQLDLFAAPPDTTDLQAPNPLNAGFFSTTRV